MLSVRIVNATRGWYESGPRIARPSQESIQLLNCQNTNLAEMGQGGAPC